MSATADRVPLGTLLRDWRRRRRLSQLDLALDAGVSARHLSFLETGRSRASRDMVLRLAERLDVPLRDRNRLLLAAGHAPAYVERGLEHPELATVRAMLQRVLDAHEPYPALAVDREWNLVAANSAVALLTQGVATELLEPPLNVLRVALHPAGLAPRIENLGEWRAHLLDRLRRQAELTADHALGALLTELEAYPDAPEAPGHETASAIAVPLRVRIGEQTLSLFSTVTTFGTAIDITVAELAVEAFLPADAETAAALAELV